MSTKKISKTYKDELYVLVKGKPISYVLASRHKEKHPLLHFDGKTQRSLRYAKNQKTPFQDEQDSNAVVEPIIFTDGTLAVPKENPVLQWFLEVHPGLGLVYRKLDLETEAEEQIAQMENEDNAITMARQMGKDELLAFFSIAFTKTATGLSSSVIKRDVFAFAKSSPEKFLEISKDPEFKIKGDVRKFFDLKLITLRNSNRDVFYNTEANKKKMITIPMDMTPTECVIGYLKSSEGIPYYEALLEHLD
jgi:hypothetical protein